MKHKIYASILVGLSIFCFNCKSSKQQVNLADVEPIVEVSNMNVVYRGVSNPLKIAIPNARIIEASAPGLRKNNLPNGYNMNPGTGNEVKILIIALTEKGDTITKNTTLRIMDLSRPDGQINGFGCYKCIIELTKQELKECRVDVKFDDFLFESKNEIRSFKIKFAKHATIKIEGNKLNQKAIDLIDSLRIDDMVYIFDISPKLGKPFSYFKMKKVSPIKIKIIE